MVRTFIEAVKNKVDGFAVSSYLSVRNPEHEVAVKAMVQSMTKHPVVCGHELSSALGFNERTITAVLNARLIPIIADLIASLKRVQDRMDIRAPLMIVKGDGSLMDESVAKERPVETILSGPAASIIGAKALTGLQDAIIIDVGGTTTDIGILRDGRPRLDPEGAVLGGWRTRVKAVDAFTSGIGGDSRIVVARNRVHLTSLRVIPLCIASTTYPAVKKKLEAMRGDSKWVPPYMEIEAVPQMTEFYIFCKDVVGPEVSPDQERILNMVREEPMTIYEIAEKLDTHPLSLNLRKMEDLGMVLRIGLTPTDILHAEGSYVHYDATASKLGVEIQSSLLEMPESELIAQVKAHGHGEDRHRGAQEAGHGEHRRFQAGPGRLRSGQRRGQGRFEARLHLQAGRQQAPDRHRCAGRSIPAFGRGEVPDKARPARALRGGERGGSDIGQHHGDRGDAHQAQEGDGRHGQPSLHACSGWRSGGTSRR